MNQTHLQPLVDGDFIAYRVGYAVKDDEPVENALSTTRSIINNIWDRFPDGPAGRLYISGKGNFREEIATIQVYKGNRDTSLRPYYYDDIRRYMIEQHGAVTVNGMEAEDAVGIDQYKAKDRTTCIVAVDKDLKCIPGWHWNPVKEGPVVYNTKGQADSWFWKQVLMGDRVDNIRGIDGLGPKKADKLIDPCNHDWVKMYNVALAEYNRQHGSDGKRAMDETAKLVWILRKEGETYDGSKV